MWMDLSNNQSSPTEQAQAPQEGGSFPVRPQSSNSTFFAIKVIISIILAFAFPTFFIYLAKNQSIHQYSSMMLVIIWVDLFLFVTGISVFTLMPDSIRQNILRDPTKRILAYFSLALVTLPAVGSFMPQILYDALSGKQRLKIPPQIMGNPLSVILIFTVIILSLIYSYRWVIKASNASFKKYGVQQEHTSPLKLVFWMILAPFGLGEYKLLSSDLKPKTKLMITAIYYIIFLTILSLIAVYYFYIKPILR